MLALAGLLLAVAMAGRSNNADGANAAMMGGQAAAIQSQLNFSRDMEREADRIGFGVLSAAGYSPAGMAAMFERLGPSHALERQQRLPVSAQPPADAGPLWPKRATACCCQAQPCPHPACCTR